MIYVSAYNPSSFNSFTVCLFKHGDILAAFYVLFLVTFDFEAFFLLKAILEHCCTQFGLLVLLFHKAMAPDWRLNSFPIFTIIVLNFFLFFFNNIIAIFIVQISFENFFQIFKDMVLPQLVPMQIYLLIFWFLLFQSPPRAIVAEYTFY